MCAIAAGGVVTHTMVPPTPGPLFVSSILGVNIGVMILVGGLVGLPCAIVGLTYSWWINRQMPIEMRPLGASDQDGAKPPKHPPSLLMSLAPVALPVMLISISTVLTLIADSRMAATLQSDDVRWDALQARVQAANSSPPSGLMGRMATHAAMPASIWQSFQQPAPLSEVQKSEGLQALNQILLDSKFYQREAFRGVALSASTEDLTKKLGPRTKLADLQRTNRLLLEEGLPDCVHKHQWNTPIRRVSDVMSLIGDPNFALIVAALIAIWVLWRCQERSLAQLGEDLDEALLSGSVIILITAAGGAFGEMLRMVNISDWVKSSFQGSMATGVSLLLLAFAVSVVLKIAQGSSTVAMIVTAGIISSIVGENRPDYHMVYIALTISAGSLVGSWMNDSGFWIFSKMGGLTIAESLKSWTVLLGLVGTTGLVVCMFLSQVLPLV
jgi:H+/gluconate symporter-like permease